MPLAMQCATRTFQCVQFRMKSKHAFPFIPIYYLEVKHTMQVPFLKAGDIVGIGGDNAAAVRRTTGVALSVSEIKGIPDKVAVEIKGTFAEVEMARHFVQGFIDCTIFLSSRQSH
ncbi:RNA-binding KH domain-containing protein PEPPER-like [Cornus florida]|uniref:RNA-binding KH domain-containing protein PEPPER-like n=1 Tax=Cornus florida TaxID=4283 RepID=UPI0028A115A5|nr:RNA-binding KH domain-containing protein PEPPER-like [Cornus florida]